MTQHVLLYPVSKFYCQHVLLYPVSKFGCIFGCTFAEEMESFGCSGGLEGDESRQFICHRYTLGSGFSHSAVESNNMTWRLTAELGEPAQPTQTHTRTHTT